MVAYLRKWAEKGFLPTVFCYALFYGGAGQFVAGVLELIKGNTFGGTAFASYGAFWMGWFLLEYLTVTHPTAYHTAHTGKTLWCGLWAVLTFGFFIVTLRKNGCLMTIFSTLVITFALLAGGMWDERCERAAGYLGFFCGSSAIYAALAFLAHEELGFVLPGVAPVNYIPASWSNAAPPPPAHPLPAGHGLGNGHPTRLHAHVHRHTAAAATAGGSGGGGVAAATHAGKRGA
ncbi:hypothetical protein GPECTOR_239g570 [Gonium pectorale]|uniref:Uncharacterized protein n=1 Tax=Gonium pectorale TaxID=33097 RepID=A0A150FY39_GONPE|nr:hypothetical protein GPECTOR_239g570 [Gonium pectorale]|eukprot:KXZ41940.1 hypothetical protein GPECTOR_239g570 [Gonium pectorale]